ncbi:transcriptional regulator, MerR family [Lachnospiraceae bacterium KM106-2]|nr:transcriptional regulator, MerR family [Lachnospiraceae bacterium KM106-2]
MEREHYCEQKEAPTVYKIGVFSKMNKATVKTLRHYDEIGLLKPAYVESFTNYRYYSSDQLPILHQIMALRSMGFSLEEIRQVQEGMSEEMLLQQKRAQLLEQIASDTRKLSQVESYLASNGVDYDYPVRIKELPEVTVCTMRRVLKNYDELFDVMPEMGAEMELLGCECLSPDYCFTLYLDGEYKDKDIDAQICQAVTEAKEDSKLVHFETFEKVEKAACVMHKGSYDGFPKAYAAVVNWVEKNGYVICGNPRESYIDGVWNKDREEDWLSEIQFPVTKK